MKPLSEIKLNVPVTNPLPRKDRTLCATLESFKTLGVCYGLREKKKGHGRYELWREALPDERPVNHKYGSDKGDIIEALYPPIEEFTYVWEGETVLKGLGARGPAKRQPLS